jgi:hypothetical protein
MLYKDLPGSHCGRFTQSVHESTKEFPHGSITATLQWSWGSKTNEKWGAVGIRQTL